MTRHDYYTVRVILNGSLALVLWILASSCGKEDSADQSGQDANQQSPTTNSFPPRRSETDESSEHIKHVVQSLRETRDLGVISDRDIVVAGRTTSDSNFDLEWFTFNSVAIPVQLENEAYEGLARLLAANTNAFGKTMTGIGSRRKETNMLVKVILAERSSVLFLYYLGTQHAQNQTSWKLVASINGYK